MSDPRGGKQDFLGYKYNKKVDIKIFVRAEYNTGFYEFMYQEKK